MSKQWKLTRKEGKIIDEIEYCVPMKAEALNRVVNNSEYMVFAKDPKTKKLRRHGVYSTEKKALAEQRKLNKVGIQTTMTHKEKTSNQYDGVFLLMDNEGNVASAYGLDNALKSLNVIHKDDMHLRKQKSHKETMGYMAFALNSKTNKFVCTRLYDTEEKAFAFINKRANVKSSSIRVFRVVRYYKGFEFKHQDLDDCNRIKQAKEKLGEF